MSETKQTPAPNIVALPSADLTLVRDEGRSTTWLVEPHWCEWLFDRDAPDWFALETSPLAEEVKTGHEREVWRVRLGTAEVYAKVRYASASSRERRQTPASEAPRVTGRLSASASREWRIGRQALAQGVPVVHFIALGRRRGSDPADVLISIGVPKAIPLAVAWSQAASNLRRNLDAGVLHRALSGGVAGETPVPHLMPQPAGSTSDVEAGITCSMITRAVARLFADAHQRGFAHHDNHPFNILVCPGRCGGRGREEQLRGGRDAAGEMPLNREAAAPSQAARSATVTRIGTDTEHQANEGAERAARACEAVALQTAAASDGGDGDVSAIFVDVTPASLWRGRVPYRHILASLAHLDQYFHRVATRTQRLRFLRSYLDALHACEGVRDERLMEHRLVPALLRRRARHGLRLARRRDQRIWRCGKYFTTLDLARGPGRSLRATVVLDLERRHLFPEAAVPDRSEGEWRNLLKVFLSEPPDRAAVARELSHHHLQCEVMESTGWLQRVMWALFGSPHRRTFARAHKLRHRDIRAPLILAYVEERARLITRTFLIYGTST